MPLFFSNPERRRRHVWRPPHGQLYMFLGSTCVLLLLGSVFAFQQWHLFQAQATNMQSQHLATFANALSPMIAHSRLLGQEDAQEEINLSLGLTPRNAVALDRATQTGQQTHLRPITPGQYIASFSPEDGTYQAAQNFLENNGFTITRTYKHRLLIDFRGKVGQASKVFHTAINRYAAPSGRTFFANDEAPHIPTWLARNTLSINGLSNLTHWEHSPLPFKPAPLARQGKHRVSRAACPEAGSDAFLPSEIAQAYHLDDLYRQGYQGQGQTVAVFAMSTFNKQDLQGYQQCYGKKQTRIETIPVGRHASPSGEGRLETELDAELLMSSLPRLSTLKIYQTANNEADYLSQWARIVQDNVPTIAISWGQCEAEAAPQTIQQEHLLLQTAALQGQNIFAASGDGGSNSCESDEGGNQLSTSDPDAQPFVTSVGGTSLNTSNGKYQSERVWNNHQYRQDGGGNKGASGGGISHYWPMPDWQRAPGLPDSTSSSEPCQVATHSSGKYCRQVPDVSLHADPHKGYWIYCTVSSQCDKDDPWTVMGGTSAAAPLWAALMALVEEKSLKTYGHRVGFVTPLLYQIARDPQMYAASFHDVRTGHTDYNDENQGLYPARSGYDMATGLGSYNAPALANNLIKLGHLRHGGR